MTAPEIVYNRVDSKKENMGLTTWKNAPDGKILETDVTIAKNYLSQEEIKKYISDFDELIIATKKINNK